MRHGSTYLRFTHNLNPKRYVWKAKGEEILGRLYLPQSWAEKSEPRAKAGVPPEIMFATKSQIALQLIEQALADQVAPAPVLGDAAYGDSFVFRQRLRELNLEFFLQVTPEEHLGWTSGGTDCAQRQVPETGRRKACR